jgi:myo-inositol-1-phosphate synthase
MTRPLVSRDHGVHERDRAGIVIDAVRLAKLALDRGLAGALEGPSSYLMKAPPRQLPDDEAHEAVEEFIRKNARTSKARARKAGSSRFGRKAVVD